MENSEDKKVTLCSDLLIRDLLEQLLKNQIINVATYNKAIKEVATHGTN